MKRIKLILFFGLLSLHTFAQLNITAALDSTDILIGDQVQLNFKITQSAASEYLSADFRAVLDTIDALELIEIKAPTTTSIGTNAVITQSIIITSFEDGLHAIPGISFSSKTGNQTYSSLSNVVYLNVAAIEIDTTTTHLNSLLLPIKDIIEEPVKISDWIHYVLIPLGIILLLILLYLLYRRYKRLNTETEAIEEKIYIPPHVIALEKINALKQKELLQNGKIKSYYSEISYIAREYLENRFSINALEAVTREIIPALKQNKTINDQVRKQLIKTLRMADMVKFAKVKPSEDTHQFVMECIEDFVTTTQQTILPSSQEEDNQSSDKAI